VHATVEGDTHFPTLDDKQWTIESREDHSADERNEHDFSFIVMDRKQQSATSKP